MAAVEAARRQFEDGTVSALDDWLSEAAELRPPTYGKSWRGKALVSRLLGFAAEAMTGFRYTDVVGDERLHILRFEANVGDERISGVDVVRCDPEGRIVEFEIFARPPKAVLALRDAMGVRVQSDAELAKMMGLAPRGG